MKILITSGGTTVPIDDVRRIANMSHGTFGSKLARAALEREHFVDFLYAQRSLTPFALNVDLYDTHVSNMLLRAAEIEKLLLNCRGNYLRQQYKTFDDYAKWLKHSLIGKPDITILAAAVSDYGVKAAKGKLSSKDNRNIELEKLPKLISLVKKWCPTTFLVGFKLLSGATEEQLIAAAAKQIEISGTDLVIANDLEDLRAGKHTLYFVQKVNGVTQCIRQLLGDHLAMGAILTIEEVYKKWPKNK